MLARRSTFRKTLAHGRQWQSLSEPLLQQHARSITALVQRASVRSHNGLINPGLNPRWLLARSRWPSQSARQLSKDVHRFTRDVMIRTAKLLVWFVAVFGFWLLGLFVVQKDLLDRQFRTPEEWSWPAERTYKGGHLEELQGRKKGIINWPGVGRYFVGVAQLLEDPQKDGKDLKRIPQQGADLGDNEEKEPVFDISMKSGPWRRGYHDSLMGAAKAAEHCHNLLLDKTQNLVVPKEVIVGPSNPEPKPFGNVKFKIPREENCVPIVNVPEVYYLKILHTYGFDGRQRLDAALGLADWYDFKGLKSKAEEMYDWGLDIAQGSLPMGVNDIVDMKTGIISSKTFYVSANVLTASTALGRYHARHGDLDAALPIFLSVLRARRQLLQLDTEVHRPEPETGSWSDYWTTFKSLLTNDFPPTPIPTDGSEIPARSATALCEEAGIMSHIGEIFLASSLTESSPFSSRSSSSSSISNFFSKPSTNDNEFATPSSSAVKSPDAFQSGLSWTRDAMDMAEETLATLSSTEIDRPARRKCLDCLTSGMENWSIMVNRMLENSRESDAKITPKKSATGNLFWGRASEDENHRRSDGTRERWETEAKLVEARKMKVRRFVVDEDERLDPAWMTIICIG